MLCTACDFVPSLSFFQLRISNKSFYSSHIWKWFISILYDSRRYQSSGNNCFVWNIQAQMQMWIASSFSAMNRSHFVICSLRCVVDSNRLFIRSICDFLVKFLLQIQKKHDSSIELNGSWSEWFNVACKVKFECLGNSNKAHSKNSTHRLQIICSVNLWYLAIFFCS